LYAGLRKAVSYKATLVLLMTLRPSRAMMVAYFKETAMGQTAIGTGNDSSPPSQQETGGNGGEQLTHDMKDTNTNQPAGNRQSAEPGSAATASNRTAQDTRSQQAGSTGTGLGAKETGGNQDEFDMPKE
jgi:hypothetical protein